MAGESNGFWYRLNIEEDSKHDASIYRSSYSHV